ncbi:MAG: tRNA lysidine(34) synthetase TilS [Bacteroidales bacterium]|nr:tRNA lysidine(34) synthetase TilS [Bacteroidales bacterium]
MQDRFDKALSRLTAGRPDGRVLLAVSGGIDSMTMADLFLHSALRLPLAVAHVNFQLRGSESDGDEALVRRWCEKNGVPFLVKRVETGKHASERGLSVEMAARELRYDWFAELCREQGFAYLAVAHNLDDSAETLLLHLLRGTGLRGLAGIREDVPLPGAEDVRLIRPLLDFTRREIESYAVRAGVEFHVDATNADTSIARNRIRHDIFPQLASINPSFLRTFQAEMKHFAQAQHLLDEVYEAGRKDFCSEREGVIHIDIPTLQGKGQTDWWLYRILSDFGFNADQLAQIERSLDALSGKEFLSPTHRLVKDRRELRIYPLPGPGDGDLTARLDVRTFSVPAGFDPKQKPDDVLFVDADLVRLPLSARPPREGDRFRPFGMHRGTKLLSDFFTDLKLDVEQKRREVVVTMQKENGDEVIVAILGRRIDDRFKVTAATRSVAALSWKAK